MDVAAIYTRLTSVKATPSVIPQRVGFTPLICLPPAALLCWIQHVNRSIENGMGERRGFKCQKRAFLHCCRSMGDLFLPESLDACMMPTGTLA